MRKEEPEEPIFIIDEPAEEDFFKTHSPVAKAIAHAIISNPALKVIGLLGRWGSGKSTITREVSHLLSGKDDSYLIFSYDAWLHQNDPVRRSFLESLIDFLTEKDLIDNDKWQTKLKRLSGALEVTDIYESPIITTEAKLFIALSFIIVFSLSFLDYQIFQDALGQSTTKAGKWTLGLSIGLILLSGLIWLSFKRFDISSNLFPSLILNKSFEHVNRQVHKPLETTSIEFGRAFRELMKDLHDHSKKLIIVIDNLDRVDQKEAIEIWASVRSFFLSAQSDNDLGSESYHPAVILPVDKKALAQMFEASSDSKKGRDLANSFINKTFDVTFDVPLPVMSDWKRYLRDKMQFCFRNQFTEAKYFSTMQFLELWFNQSKVTITPREINKTINKTVALVMQWQNQSISYDTISYFAINKDRLYNSIIDEISLNDHPLKRFVIDWKRELAALHFGVGLDLSAQVLMTDPIRKAILTGQSSLVDPYRSLKGFEDVLERALADLPSDEKRPSPNLEVVTNAASLMAGEFESSVAEASAWRSLLDAYCEISEPSSIPHLRERVILFLPHIPADKIEDFLNASVYHIDSIISDQEMKQVAIGDIAGLISDLMKFAQNHDLELGIIDLTGTADIYVQRLCWMHSFPHARVKIRTSATADDIVNELVRRLRENSNALELPAIVGLLTSEAGIKLLKDTGLDCKPVIAVCEEVVRNNVGEDETLRAGLAILSAISGFETERRDALERLAGEGILSNKFDSIVETRDSDAASVSMAAILNSSTRVEPPSGGGWSSFVRKNPDIIKQTNLFLDEIYGDSGPIKLLQGYYAKNPSTGDLIRALFAERIARGSLGKVNLQTTLANLSDYLVLVRWHSHEKFVSLLTNYQAFWQNLQELPWSQNLVDAIEHLIKSDEESADRIMDEVIDRINNSSSEEWLKAIQSNHELFRCATKLVDRRSLKLGVHSTLTESLIESSSTIFTLPKSVAERWFALSEILTSHARRAVFVELRTSLYKARPRDKLKILRVGSDKFAKSARFPSDATRSVEELIIPLMRSEAGRAWLERYSSEMHSTVKAASPAARQKLKKLAGNISKSKKNRLKDWDKVAAKWLKD